MEEIQAFIKDVASKLIGFKALSDETCSVEQLRAFCLAFHQLLIEDLRTEDVNVVRNWGGDDGRVQASLRSA